MTSPLLIVGELFVDVTVAQRKDDNKLRLGGITHAARGAWALDAAYTVGAVGPTYLEENAAKYLAEFGCKRFTPIATVSGSPNVIMIVDPLEIGDQGYEDLLREEKKVTPIEPNTDLISSEDVLIVPGKYDLAAVREWIHPAAKIHIDIAYDVGSLDELRPIAEQLETVFISTSSILFSKLIESGISDLARSVRAISDCNIVLKENRGGSRIIPKGTDSTVRISATLNETKNSVGVGDVYDVAFIHHLDRGPEDAGWLASRVSSAYAQTTYPDTFLEYTKRSLKVRPEQMKLLGGVSVPWEQRPSVQIYLAAPDFSYRDTTQIDRVVAALEYHNFRVRRPVKENGELVIDASMPELVSTYSKDAALLSECALVFAIPLDRDAGTLVEVGMAIELQIPVVTFDPVDEARNTMVVAGSDCYSHSLDQCLNAVFTIAGRLLND